IVRKKGKMVQDHVYIAGRDEHHPEGAYYLEWLEFGRRRRKSVSDYNELDEAARLKAIEVEAMKAGLIAPPAEPPRPVVNLKILSTAVDHYLSMVEAQRSPKTYKSYRHTLRQLLVPCYTKNSVDDVCREDILAFINYCYEKGLGHRTV